MKRKYLLILSLLSVLVLGALFYFFKSKKAEVIIQTTKVEKGDIQTLVTATGKLNPLMSVAVGTQVSGIVSKIYVDFNSVVKRGQVIAEIDRTALSASVEDAKANVDKAKFQADQLKREYDRQKQLFDEKVIAKADLETAETNYRASMSTLNSVRSQLNRALVNLNYATIVAPINGVVVARSVDVGQTVAASFNTPTLFTIANDLTKMQVEASVDEADIGNIKLGQKVEFSVDAYSNDTFVGIVKQIRLQPTITQNVVTYTVIIEVNNADLKLLPGMTANINVIIEKHENVTKVPTGALRFNPDYDLLKDYLKQLPDSTRKRMKEFSKNKAGGGFKRSITSGSKGRVWVKNGESIHPVKVEIGLSDGTSVEVKGKLDEGDEVIISASQVDASAPAAQGQNPFAPKMPSRKGSGGSGGSGGGRRGGM